jgi:hypothetical protein
MMNQFANPMKARTAVTLLECIVALSLLAVGMVLTTEVLTACAESHRSGEILMAAQLETTNIAEQIAAMEYDEVTQPALDKLTLSPGLQASLPDAKLHLEIFPSATNDLPSKRVRIEINWPGKDETPIAVGLTTWKYRVTKEAR